MNPEVIRVGTGHRLLLLHSGFCTWVEYRRLIDLLAEDHEILAPTLPGSSGGPLIDVRRPMLDQHGDYVADVLDAAGWTEPVDVVGSSFGGVLALELLARGRAASAIALAPPWTTGAGLAFYAALFGSGLPVLRMTRSLWPRSTHWGTLNGLWFHQSRQHPLIDAEDVAAILDSSSRFPFFTVGLRSRGRGPGMPAFNQIDQSRATLVWGGRDLLVPPWMRRRWAEALPDAQVRTLPGFPHQPHLRDPAVIADVIRTAQR